MGVSQPAVTAGLPEAYSLEMGTFQLHPQPASSRPAVRPGPPSSRLAAAVGGVVAGAAGIAAGELLAGVVPGAPSLVIAVGTLVIALQPPGAKDLVIGLFGTNDKLALNVAVLVVALVVAAWAGLVARQRFTTAAFLFAAFGVLAFVGAVYAELADPRLALLGAVVGVGAGIAVLRLLVPASVGTKDAAAQMPDWDRRRFLVSSAAIGAAAIAGGSLGRYLLTARRPAAAAALTTLPPVSPAGAVPPLSAAESLSAPGLTPIVVPAANFYRIDTALLVPQVDASSWQLRVTGMVAHELTFRYQDLLAMPLFEQYVTIACVSNDVGGDLVGNALWRGVHLKEVLRMAGVASGATQIVGRSVDGFTVGFPTAWALDPAREPMIALGMNGAPLPDVHGYPARLIVPGLYGYVSATKWLSQIELTTREAFDGFWVPLGWAKDGPILTQSRIDHPKNGEKVGAGRNWIDGVAWAPDRGVEGVEVRVDRGAWQRALTSRPISRATWVQWMLEWAAPQGQHTIEVRAIDGTGAIQTAAETPVSPDGARGHHTITVVVG